MQVRTSARGAVGHSVPKAQQLGAGLGNGARQRLWASGGPDPSYRGLCPVLCSPHHRACGPLSSKEASTTWTYHLGCSPMTTWSPFCGRWGPCQGSSAGAQGAVTCAATTCTTTTPDHTA
jgi:hypothetical protein